ncbi:MAG: hypothetical protein QOI07_905 [Verrucomicrobiota bacterium]|jgi:hypothetical protein
MTFKATRARVHNRGYPPESFLEELIEWGRKAPDEIFASNAVPVDIYTVIKSSLATPHGHDGAGTPSFTWDTILQRRAAMMEAMRVHAGMESSWNWNEGVDTTNRTSMANITGQETGVFQISFDSLWLGNNAMLPFAKAHNIDTPEKFIPAMKHDHKLALEFYARLARVSIRWAGPLLRHGTDSVYPWLSRAAVAEFMEFLK